VLCTELSDVDYVLYVLTGLPEVSVHYELPASIREIVHVPLWGTQDPFEYAFAHDGLRDVLRRRRRTTRGIIERTFLPLFARLLGALRDGDGSVKTGGVLHAMWRYFHRHDWNRTWRSPSVWESFVANALHRDVNDRELLPHEQPRAEDLTMSLRCLRNLLLPLAGAVPRADVVHSTVAGSASLPGILAKHEHGTPFVLTEHGVLVRERYMSMAADELSHHTSRFLARLSVLLARLSYSHADAIAPVAEFNQRWEIALGADPDRIETIYNGIDTAVYRPRPKPSSRSRPTVVAAARVFPLKDIETMIGAAAVAREALPEVQFVVYGSVEADPCYVARCRALIAKLGLENTFELAGMHSNSAEIYLEGDISVLSSISEGVPYAVLESLSCGRPVVATDVGGVSEILQGYGTLVPPRDPRRLGEAVVALLVDDARRMELGRQGREWVLKRFQTEQTVDAYRRLYGRLAAPLLEARPGDPAAAPAVVVA